MNLDLPVDKQYWEKEIKCGDPRCEVTFTPSIPHQKYCSPVCRQRVKDRKKSRNRNTQRKEREVLVKECPRCGDTFTTKIKEKIFCTLYCAKGEHKKKQRDKRPKKIKKENRDKYLDKQAEYYFNVKLTEEEISNVSHSIKYSQLQYCVYFIWRDDIVVYVGKAVRDLGARLKNHYDKLEKGIWGFTHITYHVHGKRQGLEKKENRYIYHYKNMGQCEYNNPLEGRVKIVTDNFFIDDIV